MSDDQSNEQISDEELEIKPIDKWDCSAVKNRLDDAVKFYFIHQLGFRENFILIDGRLAISSAAVIIALYALVWDFFNPFPASKPVLAVCVLAYFAMMGVLTIYTTAIEKGTFLKGEKKNRKLTVSSYMKRFDDRYQVIIELKDIKTGALSKVQSENSVANWFDTLGYFLYKKFDGELLKLDHKLSEDLKKKGN